MLVTRVAVGSTIQSVDTVEYEGKLWLVPVWVDSNDGKWQRPLRLVRPVFQDFQQFDGDVYFLALPVPEELLAESLDPPPAAEGYEIRERPELVLPHLSARN